MSSSQHVTNNAEPNSKILVTQGFQQDHGVHVATLADDDRPRITAPSNREGWEKWLHKPFIQEQAKLHPERAVSVMFCLDDILKEEARLEQALEAGGYRVHSRVQLFSIYALVDEALVSDLHEIAIDLGIDRYGIYDEPDFDVMLGECTLVATGCFEQVLDAERFRCKLKRAGIGTVVDDPSFP